MSRGMNKVTLIGNVGGDPEIRTTAGGVEVATISLATNETFKNASGAKVTTTQWHRLTAWRGLAEIAQKYVRKGSKLAVAGSIQYSKYTDKANIERYSTEIVIDELVLLDPAPEVVGVGGNGAVEGFVPIDQRS